MEETFAQLESLKQQTKQTLPQCWLLDTLRDKKKWMGKTGCFPCVGAVAYFNGIERAFVDPGPTHSALFDLLQHENNIEGCVLVTPIEPDSSEITGLVTLAKKKKIGAVCFGSLHPSSKQENVALSSLRKKGIKVFYLYCDDEVAEADRRFWIWASQERSYVHLKISLTADGMVVPIPGQKSRLAGAESRKRIHRLRGIYDGLLIGGNTVRQDNPQMTYRGDEDLPQPRKIILSRSGTFDPNLAAFQEEQPLVCADDDLLHLTRQFAKQNITSILVEGGWQVYKAFIAQQVLDEVSLVWTKKLGNLRSLKLPGRLPYGTMMQVGEDIWEIIRWPAHTTGRASPQRTSL